MSVERVARPEPDPELIRIAKAELSDLENEVAEEMNLST
jgi:hypothetical protein